MGAAPCLAAAQGPASPHLDGARFAAIVDPARTALIVVDIQVDFAAPGGLADRLGADLSSTAPAIDSIERLMPAARRAGMAIVFLKVVTRPDSDVPAMLRPKARRDPPSTAVLCRAGSGGEDFFRLQPVAGDEVIEKPLFDGFHATDLEARLRARGVESLLLAGVSDCCVDSTARTAFQRGFDVIVVSDACAAATPMLHRGALAALGSGLIDRSRRGWLR